MMNEFNAVKDYRISFIEDNKYWYVQCPYDMTVVAYLKKVPNVYFNRKSRLWHFPKFRSREFNQFKAHFNVKDPASDEIQKKERFENIPPLPDLSPEVDAFLTNTLKMIPFPYQKKGIAYGLEKKHTFVADDMGLGKTLQSISMVMASGLFPCLVVCPSTLKDNWKKEWMMVAGKRAMVLNDAVKTSWPTYHEVGMCDVFITNYESLSKYFVQEFTNGPDEPLKLPHIIFRKNIEKFKSMVIDESHKCRNPDTIQAKLVKGISKGKEMVLCLTGTALVNSPRDLISQLGILERLKVFGGKDEFIKRYVEVGKNKKPGNLKELNYYLHLNCYYRREKHEVLKDLPDKTRQIIQCEITNRKEYDQAENNFVSYLRNIKKCSDEEIERKLRGQLMVQMGILKQISAKGKLRDLKEYMEDLLYAGHKVVIFCYLTEIIQSIKKMFPGSLTIYGEDTNEQRARSIELFQKDSNSKVIICNYKSGGVGITLTASSRVLFVEYPWTFADCSQCEDRCHRIGQKDNVECGYFLGKDTIDEYCYDVIQKKKSMHDIVNGSTANIKEDVVDMLISLFTRKKGKPVEDF